MTKQISEDLLIEVTATVEGTAVPYVPARTSVLPENCQPADGGYCKDITIRIKDLDITKYVDQKVIDELAERLYDGI